MKIKRRWLKFYGKLVNNGTLDAATEAILLELDVFLIKKGAKNSIKKVFLYS